MACGFAASSAGGLASLAGGANADPGTKALDLTDGEQTFESANYSLERTSGTELLFNEANAAPNVHANASRVSAHMGYQYSPYGDVTATAETGVLVEVRGESAVPVEITLRGEMTATVESTDGAFAGVMPRLRMAGKNDDVADRQGAGYLTVETEARVAGEYGTAGSVDADLAFVGSDYDGFDGGTSWLDIVVRPQDILQNDLVPDDSSVDGPRIPSPAWTPEG